MGVVKEVRVVGVVRVVGAVEMVGLGVFLLLLRVLNGKSTTAMVRSRTEWQHHGSGALAPEDAVQLVNLGVSGEEGLLGDELGEDAADGPHVDTDRVVLTAEQDLRSAIPESDNLRHSTPTQLRIRDGYFFCPH